MTNFHRAKKKVRSRLSIFRYLSFSGVVQETKPKQQVVFDEIPLRDTSDDSDSNRDNWSRDEQPNEFKINRIRRESTFSSESLTMRKRRYSSFHATCFNDGLRTIDFVLAYEVEKQGKNKNNVKRNERTEAASNLNALYRLRFETALKDQGLELEYEPAESSIDGKTAFIKVHAPYPILERQAELKRMQKPFMESDVAESKPSFFQRLKNRIYSKDPFDLQEEYRLPKTEYYSDAFERDRRHEFLFDDDELAFFTSAQRVYLTWDVLSNVTVKLEEQKEQQLTVINILKSARKTRSDRSGNRKSLVEMQEREYKSLEEQEKNQKMANGNSNGRGRNGGNSTNESKSEINIDDDEEKINGEDDESEGESIDADKIKDLKSEADEEMERGKSATFHFLLKMGVYKCGFALHDGEVLDDEELSHAPPDEWPMRKYLYESWARARQWRYYQPLKVILVANFFFFFIYRDRTEGLAPALIIRRELISNRGES